MFQPGSALRTRIKGALLRVPFVSTRLRDRLYRTLTAEQRAVVDGIDGRAVVIDVGANVGNFCDLFSSRGANVIAFEPNPHAYEVLAHKAMPRVLALRYAADTERSEKRLFHHVLAEQDALGLSQSSSLLENKPNVSPEHYSSVQTLDLASFILQFPTPIYLVKMDVEGHEVRLIPHLLATGALDNVEHCFVETHERKFAELADETEAMVAAVRASGTRCRVLFDWH